MYIALDKRITRAKYSINQFKVLKVHFESFIVINLLQCFTFYIKENGMKIIHTLNKFNLKKL